MLRLYQIAFYRKGDIGPSTISETALAARLELKGIIMSGCAPTVGSASLIQHAKPRDTALHLAANGTWMEVLDLEGFQFGGKQDPRCKRHNRSRHAADSHLPVTTLSASVRELMVSTKSALSREAPRGPSAAMSECVTSRVYESAAHRLISVMETSATAAVSVLLPGPMQRLFA